MVFAYHICGRYMSGRAVKYRVLADSEIREAQSAIVRSMDKNGTGFDLKSAERHEGVLRMLVAVSKPNLQPADFAAAANGDESKITWIPVTLQSLMVGESTLEKLFPFPRDVQMLERLYAELHELDLDEVTSISGKQVPVSLG